MRLCSVGTACVLFLVLSAVSPAACSSSTKNPGAGSGGVGGDGSVPSGGTWPGGGVGGQVTADASVDGAAGNGGGGNSDAYHTLIKTAAPVAYWRFGEPTGSTYLVDEMQGLEGVQHGGLKLGEPGAIVGDSNTSAFFNPSAPNYLDTQNPPNPPQVSFSGNQPFSIEAWIFVSQTEATARTIVAKWSPTEGGYDFHVTNGKPSLMVCLTDSCDTVESAIPLQTGEWQHVVAVFKGSGASVFVNGVLGDEQTFTQTPGGAGQWFAIGCRHLGGQEAFWSGNIDELAVYDRALDVTEAMVHYNCGRGSGC